MLHRKQKTKNVLYLYEHITKLVYGLFITPRYVTCLNFAHEQPNFKIC